MKNLFFAIIFAIQATLAVAQENKLPQLEQMRMAITFAMTDVCIVDRDSRQCELFQILLGDQSSKFSEKSPETKPTTDSIRKDLIEVSKGRKNLLDSMESNGEIKLSRMYNAIKQNMDQICKIKIESKSCETSIAIFINQTDIEIGKKLNPPAKIPLKTKKDIRNFIANKYPGLTESSEILVEASTLWEMYRSN